MRLHIACHKAIAITVSKRKARNRSPEVSKAAPAVRGEQRPIFARTSRTTGHAMVVRFRYYNSMVGQWEKWQYRRFLIFIERWTVHPFSTFVLIPYYQPSKYFLMVDIICGLRLGWPLEVLVFQPCAYPFDIVGPLLSLLLSTYNGRIRRLTAIHSRVYMIAKPSVIIFTSRAVSYASTSVSVKGLSVIHTENGKLLGLT